MREELRLLPGLLSAHLTLTLFPLLVGVAVSLPLGVLCARSRRLERVALDVAGAIQTIPSLALLALMVAALNALGLRSIGYLPAFLALVLYSLLPVLRNTVTGLAGVDPALVEAADGVGMSRHERLVRVELPLALPVIVAGVRTAAVWTVGAATLATPIGADSLGNFVFAGLQTRNFTAVLVGCAAAAGLAWFLDGLGRLLLVGIRRRSRRLTALALAVFGGLYLHAGVALARGSGSAGITVGAKTFTEQYVLGEVLAARIAAATGMPCLVKQSLGSSVAFDALAGGAIDAYVDYSGTLWSNVLGRRDVPSERGSLLDALSDTLDRRYGVMLVAPLGFENSYAFVMRRERARSLGVRRLSDLAALAGGLSLSGDYEFFGRPEWNALRASYGLAFRATVSLDASLLYDAVRSEQVDVAAAFSTDGRIAAFDLVVLEDDRRALVPYDAVVLVNQRLNERHPAAVRALRELGRTIDASRMRRMNAAVDRDGRSPRSVAAEFLAAHGVAGAP